MKYLSQAHSHRLRTPFLAASALLFLTLALMAKLALAAVPADIAKASPTEFVDAVGSNALEIVKQEQDTIRSGDLTAINAIVDKHVLPYVNFEKTTRLAAGHHWRQASPEQRDQLVQAFMGTLIRTYSAAFKQVDSNSTLNILPFRGDPKADDVVVRSTLSQSNAPAVAIDYRLEQTPEGWKIYDINVEGIWLIQNYRNQFAQQISQNGIDGLINALNQQNR